MSKPQDLAIVKIGGNVVNNPRELNLFLKEFAKISTPKILVHGGGREATVLSEAMGLKAKMVDGRRITDSETIKIVTMVYAGLINKRIVSLLQSIDVNAIGLSGCDGDIITSTLRSPEPVDYGFVGDIDPEAGVNVSALTSILSLGMTPVISAITHDGNGTLLNTNADTIATSLAIAMAKTHTVNLVFCFEMPGVLKDPEDKASVISSLSHDSYRDYKSVGIIAGGMIPKLDNAFRAINHGVKNVIIKQASELTSTHAGTTISL